MPSKSWLGCPTCCETQPVNRDSIVAGADGTVGSAAGYLAGADNSLGILPLGTGNDFARSVGMPINPRRPAKTVASGEVSHVDLGCLTRPHLAPTTSPMPPR